ncbi:hypothetical protein [Krasilnikovia sp. M28-CT-15]|uniref:hypothetical protein n=1 Tax=Krasilnikovia sp. M28-CT-15 TaxID=3373540 RepID=UPI00399D556D
MGSDWIWELRVPTGAEPALRELYALAAERDLRTVDDPHVALAAMATGRENGQLWTNDDIDIFVNWENGTLVWALDAAFCHRRPVPEADTFRELHARLTSLWLDVARRLNADAGRVLDEWSSEQVWHLGIHEAIHPAGGWPAELGWWTYLGPDHHRPAPPLPEVATRARPMPNGALLVTLLDDPAAVDALRYEDIHTRWLQAA